MDFDQQAHKPQQIAAGLGRSIGRERVIAQSRKLFAQPVEGAERGFLARHGLGYGRFSAWAGPYGSISVCAGS